MIEFVLGLMALDAARDGLSDLLNRAHHNKYGIYEDRKGCTKWCENGEPVRLEFNKYGERAIILLGGDKEFRNFYEELQVLRYYEAIKDPNRTTYLYDFLGKREYKDFGEHKVIIYKDLYNNHKYFIYKVELKDKMNFYVIDVFYFYFDMFDFKLCRPTDGQLLSDKNKGVDNSKIYSGIMNTLNPRFNKYKSKCYRDGVGKLIKEQRIFSYYDENNIFNEKCDYKYCMDYNEYKVKLKEMNEFIELKNKEHHANNT